MVENRGEDFSATIDTALTCTIEKVLYSNKTRKGKHLDECSERLALSTFCGDLGASLQVKSVYRY